jgi:hypothetical protein
MLTQQFLLDLFMCSLERLALVASEDALLETLDAPKATRASCIERELLRTVLWTRAEAAPARRRRLGRRLLLFNLHVRKPLPLQRNRARAGGQRMRVNLSRRERTARTLLLGGGGLNAASSSFRKVK